MVVAVVLAVVAVVVVAAQACARSTRSILLLLDAAAQLDRFDLSRPSIGSIDRCSIDTVVSNNSSNGSDTTGTGLTSSQPSSNGNAQVKRKLRIRRVWAPKPPNLMPTPFKPAGLPWKCPNEP